jgi:hypothetical protein
MPPLSIGRCESLSSWLNETIWTGIGRSSFIGLDVWRFVGLARATSLAHSGSYEPAAATWNINVQKLGDLGEGLLRQIFSAHLRESEHGSNTSISLTTQEARAKCSEEVQSNLSSSH